MTVRVERQGSVVIVTLDRPGKRNAIDSEMTASLDRAFNDFEDDRSLRVMVLAAEGPVFCAGSDLVEGPGQPTPRGGEYGVVRRLLTKPVIAAVDGPALGGGFELVLACHLVVASSLASFSLPEARRGRIARFGGLFRPGSRMPSALATEMLLTGSRLTAERAYSVGLVNRLAAPGGAVALALELAEEICESSPAAVSETLLAVAALAMTAENAGWSASASAAARVAATPDRAEGDAAFADHREPQW